MANLSVLQKAAIQRAIESATDLSDNIIDGGKCNLEGGTYDYVSLKLLEIEHWLGLVITDSETTNG